MHKVRHNKWALRDRDRFGHAFALSNGENLSWIVGPRYYRCWAVGACIRVLPLMGLQAQFFPTLKLVPVNERGIVCICRDISCSDG